jgi:2-iminobutanoate/2-iminopropanoate deaminase
MKIVSGGIVEQTQQCLKNIESLLLELGLGKTDIAKSTVWLVAKEDFQGFNKAYTEFFEDHRPARSCVCSGLLVDGALIEIEVVATVKD